MPHVLYVQYADPRLYPPVERSAAIFRLRGWRVSMLGVMAEGQAAGVSDSRSVGAVERLRHRPGGLAALLSYMRFWWRAYRRAKDEKADVVYCSDILSYPAGYLIAKLTRARVVLHEHDSPDNRRGGGFRRFLKTMRVCFARKADMCILPQRERARLFQDQTGVQPRLVLNCPSLEEIEAALLKARDAKDELVLWHHGSLNASQFPSTVLDALTLLPPRIRVELAGYETESSRGYVAELMAKAERLGVADRFHVHGPLPREILYERSCLAHVGLALFANDYGEPLVGASGKTFDYLACGLPLVINNSEEWREFYSDLGIAISCDPTCAVSISQAILRYYNNSAHRAASARRGLALVRTEWNYEAQFAPVIERLSAMVEADEARR